MKFFLTAWEGLTTLLSNAKLALVELAETILSIL